MKLALLLAVAVVGCSPELTDGAYTCTSDATCPDGWTCSVGRCYRDAPPGGECRIDAQCPDQPCRIEICEDGRCLSEEMSGACNDGNFCNGRDECRDGACVNIGPEACPMCETLGCGGTCGELGLPCCEGACGPGTTCMMDVCQECGTFEGGPCCEGDCPAMGLLCDGTVCVGCGGPGQQCCLGPQFCEGGLECGPGGCAPPEGCAGVMCGEAEVCLGGGCVPCGREAQPCCTGMGFGTCAPDLVCSFGSGLCERLPCGSVGQPCCPGTPECVSGAACDFGMAGGTPVCQPCGAGGERCCPDASVGACRDPGDVCSGSGTCEECGVEGGPCCAGADASCNEGLACDSTASICVPCGASGQPCCNLIECGTAPGGLVCLRAICRESCGEAGEPCCPGSAPAHRCVSPLACDGVNCR